MGTVIITGADVHADADPTRPVASVARKGGGGFVVVVLGGITVEHDTYDAALAYAQGIAALVDADPSNPVHATVLAGEVAKRDEQIAALEAKAGSS